MSTLTRRAASFTSFYDACCRQLGAARRNASSQAQAPQRTTPSGMRQASNTGTEDVDPALVPRNEVGVQMLSRNLHSQIFRHMSCSPPETAYIQMSRDHLAMHDINPSQGATVPDIRLDLPSLQGENIDEHFWRLGTAIAEPARTMAKGFASTAIPTPPDNWVHEPGWIKYYADGSYEHVDDLGEESVITFDVETMPNYSPYAIMACAATPSAWYAWISPWLLGLDSDPFQLIPLGSPSRDRIVVGHNVSYDRARIFEEYNIKRSNTRFIDTMALHVAVKGISSPQRPSWMKWRKEKREQTAMNSEAISSLKRLARQTAARAKKEKDLARRDQLQREMAEMMESIAQLDHNVDEAAEDSPSWEDVSSLSSLAEVGWLYCGIEVSKEVRNDFMKSNPEDIRADLDTYLTYCAQDVAVTHSVFSKVLPIFLTQCPHPVSFAGMTLMGGSFLPVNETWDAYIANAESTYRASEAAVLLALCDLAVSARDLMQTERWKGDPWLAQLDWTPKVPKESRLGPAPIQAPVIPQPPKIIEVVEAGEDITYGVREDGRCAVPSWLHQFVESGSSRQDNRDIAIVLDLTVCGFSVRWSPEYGWIYLAAKDSTNLLGTTFEPDTNHLDEGVEKLFETVVTKSPAWKQLASKDGPALFAPERLPDIKASKLRSSLLSRKEMVELVELGDGSPAYHDQLLRIASKLVCKRRSSKPVFKLDPERCAENARHPVFSELDWSALVFDKPPEYIDAPKVRKSKEPGPNDVVWPKWYFDLAAPKPGKPPGTLDLTPRTRASVLLLRLSWRGFPLFHSKQHGWTFRVDQASLRNLTVRQAPLTFTDEADAALQGDVADGSFTFFKMPHKDGDEANVGSPLSKAFLPFSMDGTLSSPNELAAKALQMNAECSYWISARERIMTQMVVRDTPGKLDLGIKQPGDHSWGMIIPQVVSMGTITRRAMERTWLTASNAKKNRVGSELKAMVRAPPGYAIVGADVDSEELWISSVMGDSQFGLHGASAIGWMTLEGTKAQGTDLHSKTAKILGISRDQAKVFNYSRIYGAGKRHAELLLLQSNPSLSPQAARSLANDLYASTKGKKTRRKDAFGKPFWYGGTESFVFNRLEEIATSIAPKTPALGCGITSALMREYLVDAGDSDFMPSRINWAVQSSGVDYLHLLLVSMEYLMSRYDIKGRYLISVHDEVRYLVQEEDKYRLALALQIANLWTRSQFVYRLGFDDLPQGVAFFSAVDIDHVLRKEVDMPCITPSHPTAIPPGESLDIYQLLKFVPGASLAASPERSPSADPVGDLHGYVSHDSSIYRATDPEWLQAQVTQEYAEVQALWRRLQARKPELKQVSD